MYVNPCTLTDNFRRKLDKSEAKDMTSSHLHELLRSGERSHLSMANNTSEFDEGMRMISKWWLEVQWIPVLNDWWTLQDRVRLYKDIQPTEAVTIYLEVMRMAGDPRKNPWSAYFSTNSGSLIDNAKIGRESRNVRGGDQGGRGGKGGTKRNNQQPSPGANKKQKADKDRLCKSRRDPNLGECGFKKCKFNHECPSCGEDHSAKECKKLGSWNGQ